MSRLARLMVTAATACIAATSHAQTFWQGTSYGDTVEQVVRKVPAAGAPQKSAELKAEGIAALIHAPTTVADKAFDAYFYFGPSGLDNVILLQAHLEPVAQADAIRSVLLQALRAKYGRVSKTEDPGRSVADDTTMWFQWSSGDTDVRLVSQHHSKPLMIAYTLSGRGKARADGQAAKEYTKKANPKAEAAKL